MTAPSPQLTNEPEVAKSVAVQPETGVVHAAGAEQLDGQSAAQARDRHARHRGPRAHRQERRDAVCSPHGQAQQGLGFRTVYHGCVLGEACALASSAWLGICVLPPVSCNTAALFAPHMAGTITEGGGLIGDHHEQNLDASRFLRSDQLLCDITTSVGGIAQDISVW